MKYFTPLKTKDILSLIGLIIIGFAWTLIDQIFLPEAYQRFIAFIILVFIFCYMQFALNKPAKVIHYCNSIALITLSFEVIVGIIMHMIINKDFSYKSIMIWLILGLLPYITGFLYMKITKKLSRCMSPKLLFYFIPFVSVLLICSSGEDVIPILKKYEIAETLYYFSIPNTITFNLSAGYLSGVFIYYLTVYIPNKRRDKEVKNITSRLISPLISRIDFIFELILKYSNSEEKDMRNLNSNDFQVICENFDLNQLSGGFKINEQNIVDVASIREKLLDEWSDVMTILNRIDNVAIYIQPEEIYRYCLNIRRFN